MVQPRFSTYQRATLMGSSTFQAKCSLFTVQNSGWGKRAEEEDGRRGYPPWTDSATVRGFCPVSGVPPNKNEPCRPDGRQGSTHRCRSHLCEDRRAAKRPLVGGKAAKVLCDQQGKVRVSVAPTTSSVQPHDRAGKPTAAQTIGDSRRVRPAVPRNPASRSVPPAGAIRVE